eukprot:TRINITY_DN2823_c0_g1_i1.p1 TRINITY_DN2823_c0_g1~~TRINITY_DN2823_c0_g1_i1.p1  ORF type:complete len:271 (+),score=55.78 TRINITY_DN2823_c0_g1_i1:131-943(+)
MASVFCRQENDPRGKFRWTNHGVEPEQLMASPMPWRHNGWLAGFDFFAVRRGLQVWEEVFAPCHSLLNLRFRHLRDFMSEDEAKAFAAKFEVVDSDPNDEGIYEKRPGLLQDDVPKPFPNKKAGQFANNGAFPPDLTNIVKARFSGTDYIFHLLTGYEKPTCAGMHTPEGNFWNPYMTGTSIAMPPPLSDGMLDYWDGTPATTYQMAKDVVEFLQWCHGPEYDWRQVWPFKLYTGVFLTMGFAWIVQAFYLIKPKYTRRWYHNALRYVKP